MGLGLRYYLQEADIVEPAAVVCVECIEHDIDLAGVFSSCRPYLNSEPYLNNEPPSHMLGFTFALGYNETSLERLQSPTRAGSLG